MKFRYCGVHGSMLCGAIEARGLDVLIAKNDAEAFERLVAEAEGDSEAFEPLLALCNHFMAELVRCDVLDMMGAPPDGGHYCPLCEFEKHQEGFIAAEAVSISADAMRTYALEEGLIAKPS
jgi:hypothetical protein